MKEHAGERGRAGLPTRSTNRVCVLTTMHSARDDRIYYKEVLTLARRFDDIILIAPESPGGDAGLSQVVRHVPFRRPVGILARMWAVLRMVLLVRRLRPEIVHFHDFDLVAAAPLFKLLIGAKVVYDVHEVYPDLTLTSPRVPAFLRRIVASAVDQFETRMAQFCDLVVLAYDSPSRSFGFRSPPVIEVMNYPRLDLFERRECVNHLAGRKILLYHGSVSAVKGLFHMIEALSVVVKVEPTATLLLIGLEERELQERTVKMAARVGVLDNVVIIPWVEHTTLPGYICAAKLGLAPYLDLGQNRHVIPIKMFEYMACGIPVVGSNLPRIARYIQESGCGVVYDVSTPEALARSILDVLADEGRLREMGRRGLRAVQDRWNWGRMEERLLAAYCELERETS